MKRIVIFPHAGGSSSFYRTIIKESLEIRPRYLEYPGHLLKMGEPLAGSLDELTDYLLKELFAIKNFFEDDITFFGHSMGGIVAYEAARKLCKNNNICVNRIVISAMLPKGEINIPVEIESTDDMWNYFFLMQNKKSDIRGDQELGEILFPVIKQDLQLLKEYNECMEYTVCPLEIVKPYIFIGKKDIASLCQYKKWQCFFREKCQYHTFDGGHFYLQEDIYSFLKILYEIIL